ncbi:MAG TPA: hypothetical protein VKV21_04225 [Solirubrobacteraceae bacterium]|nr:hypothetical protein [Solirubrobacteraceae bacterium]
MALKDVRNIAIVLAIAAIVDIVPGGGTAARVVITAVTLIFLAALAWVASVSYREHRNTLYLLGDRRRALLYIAIGVIAVTLTATSRLWQSPLGSVAWLVLIAAAIYAGIWVLLSARRY